MKLSKTDTLFIRACKAKNPLKQVTAVHRRFYCVSGNSYPYIIDILARLVDENLDYTVREFITDTTAVVFFKRTPEERMIWALINKIRFAGKDEFKNEITWHSKWRR